MRSRPVAASPNVSMCATRRRWPTSPRRLKTFTEMLFARVQIAPEEPPRVLPLRDGIELKNRFRAALGLKA